MCDEYYRRKKMFMGIVLLVFGFIWYLNETGSIILEPFWPIIAILAGVLLILKAMMIHPETKRRR
jgi:tellurite resistance protein TehA-like permease